MSWNTVCGLWNGIHDIWIRGADFRFFHRGFSLRCHIIVEGRGATKYEDVSCFVAWRLFLSCFWRSFMAFLAPKGIYIAYFILVPFLFYLVCGECAQHWEQRVQYWERLNFWEFGLTNFFHLNVHCFLFALWAGQSVVCPSWFPCLGGYGWISLIGLWFWGCYFNKCGHV